MGQAPLVAIGIGVGEFLVLGIIYLSVIAWVLRKRHCPASTDPTCAKCGYIVRGISSLNCPECGSDLREVGIIPPGTRRPMGTLGWSVIWTLLLSLPAVLLTPLAMDTFGPWTYTSTMQRSILYQAKHLNLTLSANTKGSKVFWGKHKVNPSVTMETLEIAITDGPVKTPPLVVNLTNNSWTFKGANSQTITKPDFGIEAILTLLEAGEIETSGQQMQDRAKDILAAISKMPQIQGKIVYLNKTQPEWPAITVGPTLASTTCLPLPGTNYVTCAFWLLIWAIGLWQIIRHLHRKHQAAMEPQPTAQA